MDTSFVSIKLHEYRELRLPARFAPFIYGSSPLLGSWNPDQALKMIQAEELTWELELAVPPQHEELEFNFLVKDLDNPGIWKPEETYERFLFPTNGEQMSRAFAEFKNLANVNGLSLPFVVHIEKVSPDVLAAMWKVHKGGLQLKATHTEARNSGGNTLLGNLISLTSPLKRKSENHSAEDVVDAEGNEERDGINAQNEDQTPLISDMEPSKQSLPSSKPIANARSVSIQDLVILGAESEKMQQSWQDEEDDAKHVFSEMPPMDDETIPDSAATTEKYPGINWHTSLLADQLLVPKERRRLAIIMVGLPARGKTFTATKLTRYLRWLGHKTKHFNVGQYRRIKHGHNQTADFFRLDNREGLDARNEVAGFAMDDMLLWMQEGGQIGIFDATNSTKERRKMLLRKAEGKCKVIFLEIICNDTSVTERNICLKIKQSPDYVDMPDFEESKHDFKSRLMNYEKAYEPVAEGSYIKMIDTVGGEGGQVQINKIGGYLPGRILFFLVNTHTNPRPIFLTRPGESLGSVQNLVGGDKSLSVNGEKYAELLAKFIKERLKKEPAASVWTSTLQRTIVTAKHLAQFPKVQWRALDDISAGICDSMTYDEIKLKMPEEYKARSLDKLRYRYPRGESYLDVIQRLEPVIIELERQHSPVLIVAHQAVLRSLYGYFADKPIEQIPYVELPVHTVIEIQMGVVGVEEKRHMLLD